MRVPKPSAAMIVAVIAMVFAMTGAGVAAINATSVDGVSAVKSGASAKRAAGKLVTTQRRGNGKGTIAARYLNPGTTFGKTFQVEDNRVLSPVAIGGISGLGTLTASCYDQNQVAGNEDPATQVVFGNTSGTTVGISRSVGVNGPTVGTVPNGAQSSFTIGGSNTFELHIQRANVNYFVRGVVRQDGRGSAAASCVVYGFSLAVK
ncbi:MAG TPA: hypothetical protein VNT22_06775 [Baekduia sp.]|nr:hypothetical protein [Baekduia sp.]